APAVALWPRLLTGRAGFIGSAVIMAAAQLGLVLAPGVGVVSAAFVLSFSTALAFVVVLSLPPRVAPAGDVARMSAAIFTLQYAIAFVIPLLAAALWDATGQAAFAFAPGVLAAGPMSNRCRRLPRQVAGKENDPNGSPLRLRNRSCDQLRLRLTVPSARSLIVPQ